MLREAEGIKRILVACGRTDLRRGIDGLAAIVRLAYGLDPLEEGTLFLFCGVKKDRLKGLIFEGIGFCLFTLRLSDGRFQWPNTPDEARDITMEQYRRLLDGFTVESSIRRYVRKKFGKSMKSSFFQRLDHSVYCSRNSDITLIIM